LARKLEQAIVRASVKAKSNTREALEQKMKKAEEKRQQRLATKASKVLEHNDKVRETQIKKIEEQLNLNILKQQMLETKLRIAELKAKEHIQKQLLKAQEMGTAKVNLAKETREVREAKRNSMALYLSDEEKQDSKALALNAIVQRNKDRNYGILKNANTKRFQSIMDRQKKAKDLSERQARAQERRNLIIKNKVEKAKKTQEIFKVQVKSESPKPVAFEVHEEAPAETGFKHLVEINKPSLRPSFLRTNADIEALRLKNQEKMEKATQAREMALTKKVNLAKRTQTMFAPTEELLKEIKAEKEKTRKIYASNFDKKSSKAFTINFDREGDRTQDESSSERSVFI